MSKLTLTLAHLSVRGEQLLFASCPSHWVHMQNITKQVKGTGSLDRLGVHHSCRSEQVNLTGIFTAQTNLFAVNNDNYTGQSIRNIIISLCQLVSECENPVLSVKGSHML